MFVGFGLRSAQLRRAGLRHFDRLSIDKLRVNSAGLAEKKNESPPVPEQDAVLGKGKNMLYNRKKIKENPPKARRGKSKESFNNR